MGRRVVIAAIAAFALIGGSAFATSRWIITSPRQIKPSVLHKIETRLFWRTAMGPTTTMCPAGGNTSGQCAIGSSDARCGGGIATGGGLDGGNNPPVSATIGYSEPDTDGHGWHVIMANDDGSSSASYQAVASCQGVSGGFAAVDARAPAAVKAQISREVASLRAATTEPTKH
jgi:hypothetical protein